MKKVFFGNLWVNIKNKNDLIDKIILSLSNTNYPSVFFYLNSASYYYKSIQNKFTISFKKARYIYLNSFYLGIIFKKFYSLRLEKINAEDFFFELMSFAEKNGLRVFILGGNKKVSKKVIKYLGKKYKKIKLNGNHGYFKSDFQIVDKINRSPSDILIVGLGSGYQEPWIIKNLAHFRKIKSIIAVGNFIDILGGGTKSPPKLIRKLGLEWFYRFINEPKRLWKRYLIGGIIVLKQLILSLLSKKSRN